jgi:single-strand DNA-binding protein
MDAKELTRINESANRDKDKRYFTTIVNFYINMYHTAVRFIICIKLLPKSKQKSKRRRRNFLPGQSVKEKGTKSMNKIILLGRLTKDPEVRYTSTSKVVAQFTLAVDRPYSKDKQREADFIPVVIWGKQAEICGNYLSKGQRVLVEGRLQIRSYDAKDGQKKYVTEVIAEHFEFIERREQGGESQHTPGEESQDFQGFGSAVPFNEEIPF